MIEITRPYREALRAAVLEQRAAHLATEGAQLEGFYRGLPPFFHEVWARSILDPAVPQLANTDGEELVETRVQFEVLDRPAALGALNGSPLEQLEGEVWDWSQFNSEGKRVSMGTVQLGERTLELTANSVARGARGRQLLEQLAGASIRHRATTHEDLQRKLKEALKRPEPGESPRDPGISPELQEALVLDHYATHYREWLDLPVPAIDELTPRDASTRPAMKARLVELLKGLDGLYQRALEDNQPAYDPSWMWDELGLTEAADPHPPPLAFERVCYAVPGLREALTRVADQRRSAKAPPFDDDSLRLDLEVQRLVREAPAASGWTTTLANFELERRKAFWVDEALAFMLANTELDVRGAELRVPFASFALVFTDRHALSMGERLLARQPGNPLKGRYLQILTVFVTERGERDDRSLEVCFCFDALGAELPVQLKHHIPLPAEGLAQAYLEAVAPLALQDAAAYTNPLRGLLQVTLNALLFATSAGVEPERRPAPQRPSARPRARGGPPLSYSSDEVYYLPGAIEISQVRRLQELERHSEGRGVLRRFMVRGHWRRPRAGSTEQRLSWVRPHWKGPDLATVIERTYKLKP